MKQNAVVKCVPGDSEPYFGLISPGRAWLGLAWPGLSGAFLLLATLTFLDEKAPG